MTKTDLTRELITVDDDFRRYLRSQNQVIPLVISESF